MESDNTTISPEDISLILTHLSLPPSTTLPLPPIPFLQKYIHNLPPPLLRLFIPITTPRQRSSIPLIKSRRLIYASTSPSELTAESGRLRWPLLWERMGGLSLPFLSSSSSATGTGARSGDSSGSQLKDEQKFGEGIMNGFPQYVKKLGGLLREYEEEREFEMVREARRVERGLEGGEEFDSDSDDEIPPGAGGGGGGGGGGEEMDQEEVRSMFERKLLELFIDGLDTIPYEEIDFTEPSHQDLTLLRDMEDRYFDSESPTPSTLVVEGRTENGEGEYDY